MAETGFSPGNYSATRAGVIGAVTILLAGAVVQFSGIGFSKLLFALDIFAGVFLALSVYYGLKATGVVGGKLGRYVDLVAIGIGAYGIVFQLINIPYQSLGQPVVFGLSSSFWLASTHALQIFGVSVAASGFYLMWREVK